MSKKFYDRILSGTGACSNESAPPVGAKILAKFGWKNGDGLGVKKQGITKCIQIKRREEGCGLGNETRTKDEWDDWWSQSYNSLAGKLVNPSVRERERAQKDSTDDDSDMNSNISRAGAIKRGSCQRGKHIRIARQERKNGEV